MGRAEWLFLAVVWVIGVSCLEIALGAAALTMLHVPGNGNQHYGASFFITAYIWVQRLALKIKIGD